MPEIQNKNSASSEDDFDEPSSMVEPLEKIREITKFWKTRRAILSGLPLYDFSKKALDDEGYLGPWKFNLLQSTLSALPAVIVPFLARYFHISTSDADSDDILNEVFESFALPFILMLTAFVVGRASVWKADSTKATKKRAARIFLYLDGALGLFPQLFAVAVLSIADYDQFELPSFVLWLISMWQLFVTMNTIPDRLFLVLGYRTRRRKQLRMNQLRFGRPPMEPDMSLPKPPTWKYRFCILCVVPTITLGVGAIFGIVCSLAESWWKSHLK
jgi:hypothetical protein